MRRRRGQSGQALPLALALALLLLAGIAALVALGHVHVAAARAQTAADLAALSAARELRARLAEAAAAPPGAQGRLRAALAAAATESARPAGARVVDVRLPDGAWPPTAVEVVVAEPALRGGEVVAIARAGLAVTVSTAGEASVGWASGGGYSGPLLYRDGKPMCPAVAAAFDLMDAAARAEGVDLVVTSGFRTDAEQAILFARHPDPRWVAPPGRSRHRDATELDLNMAAGGGRAHAWLSRNAGRFGFVKRYSWEPWHWGYVPGCGGRVSADARAARSAAGLPSWVPPAYRVPVASAAAAHGVPPALLAALLRAESGFDPRAVSPAGAQGIAQFMPATARGMGLADPFDPAQAIPAAARLLAGHLGALGSVPLALAAYNAGPGAVARYGGIPPYRETQAYVARVMALAGGAGALGPGGPGGDGVVLLRAGDRFV